jgi:hypothetical protein
MMKPYPSLARTSFWIFIISSNFYLEHITKRFTQIELVIFQPLPRVVHAAIFTTKFSTRYFVYSTPPFTHLSGVRFTYSGSFPQLDRAVFIFQPSLISLQKVGNLRLAAASVRSGI